MPKKNKKWISRTTLGDSVYSFLVLDSAWPIFKNSPIFIQEQNEKFKFVLPWCWYWNFMIMTWHSQINDCKLFQLRCVIWTFRLKVAIVTDFHCSSGELVNHNAANGKSTACFSDIFCVCVFLCNWKPCDTPNRHASHRVFKNMKPGKRISWVGGGGWIDLMAHSWKVDWMQPKRKYSEDERV